MANYKWVSEANSFVPYETEYETYTDDNGEQQQREIEPTFIVYTQEQINTIFASKGANQGIHDVDGQPVVFDIYTAEQLEAAANAQRISVLNRWFNTEYRVEFEKAYRLTALNIPYSHYDKLRDKTYTSLVQVLNEGELVRAEIQTLGG